MSSNKQSKKQTGDKFIFLITMALFGCLGPVVRAIGLPSPVTACFRAIIASVSLILFLVFMKKPLNWPLFKRSLLPLTICGICMAGDWIFLFEAYNYTTVATATVCYYIAPILFIIAAALVLKEKLGVKHIVCILAAFVGMALVSGVADAELPSRGEFLGVLFAVIGAVCYAVIIVLNKKYLYAMDPIVCTAGQLSVTSILTLVYILIREDMSSLHVTATGVLLLLFLGVIMTAIAYIIYFHKIKVIPSQTVAIFSYADPVVAVLFSTLFLHEPISVLGLVGAVLVIGAALVAEL